SRRDPVTTTSSTAGAAAAFSEGVAWASTSGAAAEPAAVAKARRTARRSTRLELITRRPPLVKWARSRRVTLFRLRESCGDGPRHSFAQILHTLFTLCKRSIRIGPCFSFSAACVPDDVAQLPHQLRPSPDATSGEPAVRRHRDAGVPTVKRGHLV